MSNDVNYKIDLDNYDIDPYGITGASDPSTFTITLPSDDDLISFNNVYTTGTDNYSFDYNYNPGVDVTAGDLKVHNEGDIKLGERSLKEFMDKVEERMNILRPNQELEEQWDELKKLGDSYRKLEKELLEKNKMWEALKKS